MITLIFCGDLRYCPYLKRYTERLDLMHLEYEVLFWNRAGLHLDLPKNYYYYDSASDEGSCKINKAMDFYKFKCWIDHHLSRHKPHALILLSTLTGILSFSKIRAFPYIFDIRDYSFEKFSLFRKLERSVISHSYFTSISSKGFKSFLPNSSYILAHNFNREEIPLKNRIIEKKRTINIVWNGTVRFFDFQKRYLDVFQNDSRFKFIYHGAGTDLEMYKSYCQKQKIRNVEFTGAYDNIDKEKLLQDADILNNCYGGRSGDELKYAVSNRFYDGLIYHIPQIVEPDGFKASLTEQSGVGIALSPTPDAPDILYSYYCDLEIKKFENSCVHLLDEIIKEDDVYIKKIDEFIIKYGS